MELMKIEIKRKSFSRKMCKKMDLLSEGERGKEKRVTKKFINDLKKTEKQ
ncbi:hypothetical protein ACFLQ8_03340 [Candidatus Auribacterota bacterium]